MPKAEASVEHLLASANGGSNSDENCVACCKAVNALLGRMSLKEKFQVVLNQKGQFKCPNGTGTVKATAKPKDERLALVIANLKQRGNSKPRTLKTLISTVASLFPKGISEADLAALVQQLQSTGKVTVEGSKVIYAL